MYHGGIKMNVLDGLKDKTCDFTNETNYSRGLIQENINKTIIGRNKELETINKHFDCVLEGECEHRKKNVGQ